MELVAEVVGGQLTITRDADVNKFVTAVEQITFNGSDAVARQQSVLYVTERCVFRLTAVGPELMEIAPGVDLERDILARMAFRPCISPELKLMDARIFSEAPMALREAMLS